LRVAENLDANLNETMNRLLTTILAAGLALLMAKTARAENEETSIQCRKSASFLAPIDSTDYRKYAPEREVLVLHLAIEITPDFKQRTIEGKTTIRFKPNAKPVQELKLDAVNLNIHAVESTEKVQHYEVAGQKLVVTFAAPVPADKEASVTIAYSAEPRQGLYFRTPEMGYKEGDTHLFTQGEAIQARHWYPCLDAPNMKSASEVTCRVPEGMTVISNGRLVSETKDPATGLIASHWSQEKPHANYLITLVAGYLKKLEDKADGVPLAFYTPPSEIQYAQTSFRTTKEIMEFFNQEIGVPYPWPKYDQICVNDFVAGGMENTSATTLTDRTLFTEETETIHSSDSLVAHEMAHQWFGDLVTCKDWSHLWLNEGFATYYDALFDGHKNGRDAMLYGLYGNARQILGAMNDTNPIVRRTYDSPDSMFDFLAYPKGGWVLHMLRSQLGEELYRRCIKTFLERHAYGSVTTEDLRRVIEELSGRYYDRFFDQWVYHAHHPELDASYSWDERTKLAKLTIRQVQKLGDNVLLFDFPLAVRFKGSIGATNRTIHVTAKEEDFTFALDSAPTLVRLDPDYTLLAKITFSPGTPMVYAQLADNQDVMGRVLAIDQLSNRRDKETVAKLKQVVNNDPFYGVRVEAARALRSVHTDEAFEALLASTKQPDARVRLEVMNAIGGFYRETAYDSARQALETEKNPAILASEIRDLGGYSKPEVRNVLIKYLASESFENRLADAAINAIRSQDDPGYIAPLQETLGKREKDFTTSGFAQGLRALGYLGRNEEKKDAVRDFLLKYLNHKKRSLQLASISALGTLGDPQAIAALNKLATAGKESPERGAAERAVADLRAARKPVDDFKNLRQEVLDLQKQNRDLRKDLDELKKKVETRQPVAPEPQTKKKKPAVQSPKQVP
jgi:aminopeptidase N